MVILPGIRVIVRRFLCIERRFLSDWSKKFYVDVLAQCALVTAQYLNGQYAISHWIVLYHCSLQW